MLSIERHLVFGSWSQQDSAEAVEEALEAAVLKGKVPRELLANKKTVGEILNVVFEERCEKKLIQPTFVIDHPIEASPFL